MRKYFVAFVTFKALDLVIIIMAAAALIQAQAPRTWVSGLGDDTNPCSRTAPCKTFAGAISKTATNMITSNTTAFATSGGTITSFTSNMFQGNTNPSSPTTTVTLQ
ncbi:MAG TPA: hypothetical protein VGO50_10370 [Pyrinomonadaceae bacterium]|jgi:hypothetical protein|nr:hypothetical protein [Pyrinomonadaceae bacterium]